MVFYKEAEKIHNAWLKTLEDGLHTYDIYQEGKSKQKLGTKEFAKSIIERLGEAPSQLKPVLYKKPEAVLQKNIATSLPKTKTLLGVDVFLDSKQDVTTLGQALESLNTKLKLQGISNRGLRVWPNPKKTAFYCDHWRCRFKNQDGAPATHEDILQLLTLIKNKNLDFIKTEGLFAFDGKNGFSEMQG